MTRDVLREHGAALAAITTVTVVPVAGAVLALDLIAWQAVDPGSPGAALRELGSTPRLVDDPRFGRFAVARYALGGLVYVVVTVVALRRTRTPVASAPPRTAGRATWTRGAGIVAAAIAAAAVVRISLSTAGSAALAPAAATADLAYLAPINVVHAVGKVLTAPLVAAAFVAARAERRAP